MTDLGIRSTQGGFTQSGFFSPSEKRVAVALEMKKTHFSFGNHKRINYTEHQKNYMNHSKSQAQMKQIGSR